MNITRRALLLTALAAPAIIRTPGLLMPVRKVAPEFDFHRSVTADGLTLLQWSVDFERMVYQWHDRPISTVSGAITFEAVDEGLFRLPPDASKLRSPA